MSRAASDFWGLLKGFRGKVYSSDHVEVGLGGQAKDTDHLGRHGLLAKIKCREAWPWERIKVMKA